MNLIVDNKDLWYLSEAVQYRLFTINKELQSLSGSTTEYGEYMRDVLTEQYNILARLSDEIEHAQDITEDVTKDYIAEQFEQDNS